VNGARWFGELSRDAELNRLGRVVISLEQGYWDSLPGTYVHTIVMALWHLLGGRQQLKRFDAHHFRDYIWRRYFARTLPSADFDLVTDVAFRIARVPWNAMHILRHGNAQNGIPVAVSPPRHVGFRHDDCRNAVSRHRFQTNQAGGALSRRHPVAHAAYHFGQTLASSFSLSCTAQKCGEWGLVRLCIGVHP